MSPCEEHLIQKRADGLEKPAHGPMLRWSAQVALVRPSKLMDEIDEVLEENAEEFVRSDVQPGGE
jgi:ubiquitin-like protein Pup